MYIKKTDITFFNFSSTLNMQHFYTCIYILQHYMLNLVQKKPWTVSIKKDDFLFGPLFSLQNEKLTQCNNRNEHAF